MSQRMIQRFALGGAAGLVIGMTGYPWLLIPVGFGILSASNIFNDGKPEVTIEFIETAGAMVGVYLLYSMY